MNRLTEPNYTYDDCDFMESGMAPYMNRLAAYEDAEAEGRLIALPCRIGDQVWTIRNHGGVPHVYTGAVSEIFFAEDDAGVTRLCMAVKGVSKGFWGERFFNTREEAEAALKEAHNGK